MSDTSIIMMTVDEIIKNTFGDADINIVNFKLMQAILFLMARQVRLLDRKIELCGIYNAPGSSDTTLSVTEVKVYASVPKKARRKQEKPVKGKESLISKKISSTGRMAPSTLKRSDDMPASEKEKTTEGKKITEEKIFGNYQESSPKLTDDNIHGLNKSTSQSKKGKYDENESDISKRIDDSQQNKMGKVDSKKKATGKPAATGQGTTKQQPETGTVAKVSTPTSIESFKTRKTVSKESSTPKSSESVESTEVRTEKLLIMERVPATEAKTKTKKPAGTAAAAAATARSHPRLSIVTEEQFDKLVDRVIELETQFVTNDAEHVVVENAKLIEQMNKSASLSDAIAALQLSARIDNAEKDLQNMISFLNELSKTRTMRGDIEDPEQKHIGHAVIHDALKPKSSISLDEMQDKESSDVLYEGPDAETQAKPSAVNLGEKASEMISVIPHTKSTEKKPFTKEDSKKYADINYITREELDDNLKDVHVEFIKAIDVTSDKTVYNIENTMKLCRIVELRLGRAMQLGENMNSLESDVAEFIEQINALDTALTAQMIDYQDQLTQMHYDVDVGLDKVLETLQTQGGDNEAVIDLNVRFNALQLDFDKNKANQTELADVQAAMLADLEAIWKQIELLREEKADRDEVAEGLRDKAGIGILNSLVTLSQFDAVRGDLERHITAAYDKFCNQEIIWQKVIDDLTREINEKAEYYQVIALREDVNKNLNMVMSRIQYMLNLLGEPRAGAVSKTLYRYSPCLSCANPARMKEPSLRKSPKKGKRGTSSAPKGAGDGLCYPDQLIPHPLDPRGRVCTKYCGSTVPSIKQQKQPACINISAIVRQIAIGSDGRPGTSKEQPVHCRPCHIASTLSAVKSVQKAGKLEDIQCEVKLR